MSLTFRFLLLITILLTAMGYSGSRIIDNMYEEELKIQAQTVVENVNAFGSWVASSGGIWVKGTSTNFLSHEWVRRMDGQGDSIHFYSKNPALAQRELSEILEKSEANMQFTLTSDNVMNLKNTPDKFAETAIKEIKRLGLNEYIESSGDTYRYAKTLIHKASCIKCHGKPENAPKDVIARYGKDNGFGFKEGDVAGVISVTLPKRNALTAVKSVVGPIEIIVMIAAVILVLAIMYKTVIVPVKKLTNDARKISNGEHIELEVDTINKKSSNEIQQLRLAVARMNQSIRLAVARRRKDKG
jgi:methyl-accepting chemotaxis protein